MNPHQWPQGNQSFGLMPHMFPRIINPSGGTGWPAFPSIQNQGAILWRAPQLSPQGTGLPHMSLSSQHPVMGTPFPMTSPQPGMTAGKRPLQEDTQSHESKCPRLSEHIPANVLQLGSLISKLGPDDFAALLRMMEVVPKAVVSQVKAEAVEQELAARAANEEAKPSDVDGLVCELVNTVVSTAALDCNDAQVFGEALMSSLAKTMPSREITAELLSYMMQYAVSEGLVQAEGLAKRISALPDLMTAVLRPPPGLNPEEIARMPANSQERVAKWIALNKVMVARIISLQAPNAVQFWQREGVKPIPATSNERDVYFECVRLANLNVPKSELQNFTKWFKMNLPDEFKRKKTEPPPSDVQLAQQLPSSPDASTPPAPPQVEPAAREPFKISSYNFEGFCKDAPSLKTLFPQATTLVSVNQAGKQLPFDVNSPLKSAAAQFEVALEKMGVSKTMSDEIYVQFKLATEGLGIRCSKPQVPELRRWVARALAVKYSQES